MTKFQLKKVNSADIKQELELIGFDNTYLTQATNKYKYINIKLFMLTLPQANILKQTALSVGADCAVHRDILTAKVETTDCILGGSYSQIKKIAQKISNQPFSMSKLSNELENFLNSEKEKTLPKIVGILNLTKDSFSDGGQYYEFESAIKHLNKMIDDGADIIDIGAESTKPNFTPISDEEQLRELVPVLEYINKTNISTPISIDTRSSVVAKHALDLGAKIINDISGFEHDKNMPKIIAESGAKIILQNTNFGSSIDNVFFDLKNKLKLALDSGIEKDNIILDVGIGFGKTKEQNFELIKRIDEFQSIGCKLMLGISRKSLLDMPHATNEEKDIFTVALNTLAIEKNVDYLRVHNVKLHKELIKLMEQ